MLLPRNIKSLLEKSSLYMQLRYGTFMYPLWLLMRNDVRKNNQTKQKLYEQIIRKDCLLIIDIGANEGMLTAIFSELSTRVIAVEPSVRNVSILKAKFSKNKNITVLPVAVSNANGEQVWYEDRNDYAMGTLSSKWNEKKVKTKEPATLVKTITLDSLLEKYGEPDYIKIDVEGNELSVIEGLSKKISLLSFEAILPLFLAETEQSIEHLSAIHPAAIFNFISHEAFFYPCFTSKEALLKDILRINETIDIFCRM